MKKTKIQSIALAPNHKQNAADKIIGLIAAINVLGRMAANQIDKGG